MGFTEDMKAKISLKAIVESRTSLTSIGKDRYRGLSPFTDEKTPSFYVDEDKKLWKCFSSKKGGGILDWFVETEGMSRFEAVQYISEQFDIPLEKQEEDTNQELRKCLKEAQSYFRKNRDRAVEYVKSRGYSEDIVDKYDLGYAPDSYTEIIHHLKNKGFKSEVIVTSGIGMWDNKNKGKVLARQRGRVTLPVRDKYGAITGIIGRTTTDAKPKYLNPTVSPLYKTTTTLWNFDKVRSMIKDQGKVMICEGPFDAIMGTESGIPTVSILGSSISNEQLKILSTITSDIYLCFDSDKAGRAALLDTFEKLEKSELDVLTYAIMLPEGEDIADVVKHHGIIYLNNLIDNAVPDNSVVLDVIYQQAKETSSKPSAVTRKVLEAVKPYFNNAKYSYRSLDLLDRTSQLLNLDKGKLDAWLKEGADFKHNSQVYKKIDSISFPAPVFERRIMTECLKDPSNIGRLKSMGITRYDFESQLVSQVLSIIDTARNDVFSALKEHLSSDDYDTVLSAYMNSEQVKLDIYSLGGIIVANKSKVRGSLSSVTNILGRPKNYLEREVAPTFKELLQQVNN
jgi:DNA primase catalytic core